MSKTINILKEQNLPQMEDDLEFRQGTENLYRNICDIIDNVRGEIANYVNTKICLTKWNVGNRIKEDVLFNRRAEYGKQIIKSLAIKLTEKYGSNSWNARNLQHCVRTAYTFTRDEIVYAMRIQLTWTHLRYINRYERHEWEESPIGLILCSEGNTEHVEYLILDENSPIKVAQYYTQLPNRKLLAEKYHRTIAIARELQAEKVADGNEQHV